MKKYKVKIQYEREVLAEDEQDAVNVFWADWEDECASNNTEVIIELNDTAEVEATDDLKSIVEEKIDNDRRNRKIPKR